MNLEQFNDSQKEAITNVTSNLRVIAGAGSGKTAVLTNRIAYLISECGVQEQSILAITFTNKAAKEMKDRVLKLLNRDYFEGKIMTFHGFCLRILREDINRLGLSRDFIIIDTDDQKKILTEINKKLDYDSSIFNRKNIINYISNKKNNIEYDEEDFIIKIYNEFYDEYQKYLLKHNYLDFDDLLVYVIKLFTSDSVILEKWQYRFSFVHVDEFQDTNDIQYQLLKLISKKATIFVVGDPDQTIYSWRGASIDYIMNFESEFDNAKTIKLEYNYRSKSHILDAANNLIQRNVNRLEKKLISTRDSDNKVIHHVSFDRNAEARYVVETINDIVNNTDGVNYEDFAILYRNNSISRVFEQELMLNQISYQVIGSVRFFEREEIKDLVGYLKMVYLEDDLSFIRVINKPKRKIGTKTIEQIQEVANKNNTSLINTILKHHNQIKFNKTQSIEIEKFIKVVNLALNDNFSVFEALDFFNESFEMYKIGENTDNVDNKRIDNVNELLTYAKEYQGSILDFLQELSLDSFSQDSDHKVSLMSMHAAKGLEYKYVFAAHLCDGIFPSAYSMASYDLEEERRLAYVCFTRAKEQLFLLSHTTGFMYDSLNTSIFVREIEEELINKTGRKEKNYSSSQHNLNLMKKDNLINNDEISKNKNDISMNNTQFKVGDIVLHKQFGQGVILSKHSQTLEIAFNSSVGIKLVNDNFVSKK